MTARVLTLLPARAGDRELMVGGLMLGTIVLLCVFVPLLDPSRADALIGLPFQSPSWAHPFGTDEVGRDVLVRTFLGGRVDLAVAAITVGISWGAGTVLGAALGSGKAGGADVVVMRLVDAVIAFPFLVLILTLIAVLGPTRKIGPLPPGAGSLVGALLIVDWTIYTRLARSHALSLRSREYVVAASLLGYSRARILRRHLLPSIWRTTAAYAVADIILVVIATASLAFIGAGVQPPTAEWGAIMYEGRGALASAWWITLLPGAVLLSTGLAITLIVDALLGREARR